MIWETILLHRSRKFQQGSFAIQKAISNEIKR